MSIRPTILLCFLLAYCTLAHTTDLTSSTRQMSMPLPTKGPFPTLRPRVSRTPCPLTPAEMRRVVALRRKLFHIRKRTPCVRTVCRLQRQFDRVRKCNFSGKQKQVYKSLVATCRLRRAVMDMIKAEKKYCTVGPMHRCDKVKLRKLYRQRFKIVKACLKVGRSRRSTTPGRRACPSLKDAKVELFKARRECRRSNRGDFEEFFRIKMRMLRIKRCSAKPSSAPRRKW